MDKTLEIKLASHDREVWACSSEHAVNVLQELMAKPQTEVIKMARELLISKGHDVKADTSLEDLLEPMYELKGDVGVVSVKGSLIPGEAGIFRLFGVVGYDDIANAAVQALADKKAKSILLDVTSPGGSARGVNQAAKTLRTIGELKPMSVYSDLAASGGYWLAAAGGHITLDEAALAGSIGVITVMTSYSEAYKKSGIEKTVVRAGKYKALGHPSEPTSEEAVAEVQNQLNFIYDMFVASVAEDRGTTMTTVDQTMAQGREFMGKQALQAGLVDQIGTFADALAYSAELGKQGKKRAAAQKPDNKSVKLAENATSQVAATTNATDNGNNPTTKGIKTMPFTPEQLAAIAAGEAQASANAQGAAGAQVGAAGAEGSGVAQPASVEAGSEQGAAVEKSAAELTVEIAALNTQMQTVQAKLTEAETLVATQTAAVEALQASEAKIKASAEALSAVVKSHIASMSIALGRKAPECATADDVLQAYTATTADFKANYRPGGVAKPTQAVEKPAVEAKAATPHPELSARDWEAAKNL